MDRDFRKEFEEDEDIAWDGDNFDNYGFFAYPRYEYVEAILDEIERLRTENKELRKELVAFSPLHGKE